MTTTEISMNFRSTILLEICRQSLVRRPVFSLVRLLVRPWTYRVAPAAGESCDSHTCPIPCWLCHLMNTRNLMILRQMSQHFPLPAPVNCTYSRSEWTARSCC